MESQGRGTSKGTPITMITPRLFNTFSFFCHPGLVKRDLFQPMDSLGIFEVEDPNIGRVKSQYTSIVRDVERKVIVQGLVYQNILVEGRIFYRPEEEQMF